MSTLYTMREDIRIALRLDRALRFLWQAGKGWTLANMVLVFIQGLLPLLVLYLMKLIIDAVTYAVQAPDKGQAFYQVVLLIAGAGAAALMNALVQLFAGLVKEAQSLAVTDHMYHVLHTKSVEVDLEFYENARYLDTLHRAQKEGPYRPAHIVNSLVQLGQNGISLAAMAGLLISFHWGIAGILFIAVMPGILVRLKYSKKLYQWHQETTEPERKAHYFNWILTGDGHAKEIRLFGLGNLFINRFNVLRKQLRHEKMSLTRKRSLSEFAAQMGATLAVYGTFVLIAYRTIGGVITLGDMVMYFQAFQRGLGYLQSLLGSMADLYENNLFLSNLYEFLDLKPRVKPPLHPHPVPRPIREGILFEHVSFSYPQGSRKALYDISFAMKPGEVVALVGENGSGKTTFIKLLCRLYDPTEGTITLDNTDLRQFDLAALRREFSVIFQDYVKYQLTVRENIWLGNIDAAPNETDIIEAAQRAGAHNMISHLPNAYETILGKWFDTGEELSIGEWQKIALARAFLRDSQIIVLDEPTSSLDAGTEYEIFSRFPALLEGRSAILISHRFSTVRMADRIYVFEQGRILEQGSHPDLMRAGGTYAALFEKQAQYYK